MHTIDIAECRRALAPTLSQRRQAQLAWFFERLEAGELPIAKMFQTQRVRAVSYYEAPGLDGGPAERVPVIRAILFSEGIKRDGDEVVMRGLDLAPFRAAPRMFFAHKTDEDPVGNWIPDTIRMVGMDVVVGKPVIEAHGRPLALDDGSETARRSRTVFRMLTSDPPGYDTFSGSWIPSDVEPIRNKRGQIVGIRHLTGEVTEASVAPLAADTDARMRVAEMLQSGRGYHEGGIDRRDVDFFSRSIDDAGPYVIRGLMADPGELESLDLAAGADDGATEAAAENAADTTASAEATAEASAQGRSLPEERLVRFRAAFAPVVEALLAGTLAPDTIARAVATLAATDDLADIEAALASVFEQTAKIRTLTTTHLEDPAAPAGEHSRVSKVLAGRNRTRLVQAKDCIDQVLEDDTPSHAETEERQAGVLDSDVSERTSTFVLQQVTRLREAVECMRDGQRHEEADAILDELRRAQPVTRVERMAESLRATLNPPA